MSNSATDPASAILATPQVTVELAPCGNLADRGVDTAKTNRAKAPHVLFVSTIGRTISLFAGFVATRVA